MIIATCLFGDSPLVTKLFDNWWASIQKIGRERDALVLSDAARSWIQVPQLVVQPVNVTVNLKQLTGNGAVPTTRKGLIIASAMRYLRPPFLFTDLDCEFLSDPSDELSELRGIGMAGTNESDAVDLKNSGVIHFGLGCNPMQLASQFISHFMAIQLMNSADPLKEQKAWQRVFARAEESHDLPPTMNWMPAHWGPNKDAIINHWAGRSKYNL